MKRVITFAACLLLVAAVTCGHKNERESWVARYNGPGNGTDAARFIAVDNSGNVYITGVSEGLGNTFDYATIKYNSLGKQLWVARYDGGGSEDEVYSMAVDNSGNVYVTGQTGYRLPDSSWNCDYATVKYDSSGNQLWAARYNGPGNYWDGARSLAVDNSGNVYVTGLSTGSGTYFDYATIKYDSLGNQLWVTRYNGPGNREGGANSLLVDNSGNVYVTGVSYGSSTNFDYATIKYDSRGNELWVVHYNGPGDGEDVTKFLVHDGSGNIYVTGSSKGLGTGCYDYATIKYDSSGNQLWVARYDGGGSEDEVYSMAVDNSGNVYVTGQTGYRLPDSSWNCDYATVKYDSSGNQLWAARYNGPGNYWDGARSLAVDNSGNVYVTGLSTGSGTYFDYATIKYDSLGNQLWVTRYDGPGNYMDGARSIAVDNAGNVYVTGKSDASITNSDYATIKYGPDGQ